MGDLVSTNTIFTGLRRHVVNLLNVSDGTGESAVVKVDKSTLATVDGTEPGTLVVEMIEYQLDGMVVDLFFDRTTDVKIARLTGNGLFDYRRFGGIRDTGTGDTGDIILTTTGHTSGDSYNITLHCKYSGA